MRAQAAVLVLGVAAALGTATGAVVLPDRRDAVDPVPPATTVSAPTVSPTTPASRSPSASPTPSPSVTEPGPVTDANLLAAGDFGAVDLDLVAQPSDVRLELVVCAKNETLDDIAVSGPPVQRSWAAGTVVANQQAIGARDADEAAEVVQRVLRKLEACQRRPPPYWVYGPTHSVRLGSGVTASWLGEVDGSLNTTGRAPKGEKINGGTAVVRHGSHVSVLTISWCAGAGESAPCVVAGADAYDQLVTLSRAAAVRLG